MFLNRNNATAPLAMRQSVEHFHALHEHVVILSLETLPVPHVPAEDQISVDALGFTDDGITHVSARLGYMDRSDVPALLRRIDPTEIECPLEVDEASYFLSTIELRRGSSGDLSRGARRCSSPRPTSRLMPRCISAFLANARSS